MSFRRMRHVKAREFQGCDIAYDFSKPASLYDATTGGSFVAADGAIARAEDLSGGTGHLTQAGSTSRPLRKVAALGGLDVARFDGVNDGMSAGDVAKTGLKPIEVFTVAKYTSTTFVWLLTRGKNATGKDQWGVGSYNGNDRAYYSAPSTAFSVAQTTINTNAQMLHGSMPRTAGSSASIATLWRNGKSVATGGGVTDDQSDSYDSGCTVILGALSGIGSVLNGDVGEAAKYAASFTTAQRLRLALSRCRKWRISS